MGKPSSKHASAKPRTVSENCHITPVSSGEPKFKQFVTANGFAPVVAMFRQLSARANFAPSYGSKYDQRAFPSVETATPK